MTTILASRPAKGKRSRDNSGELTRNGSADHPAKRQRTGHEPRDAVVKHALLSQYYSETRTLRQYALSKLPTSSRIRRKKIATVGLSGSSVQKSSTEEETILGELLDTTLVAWRHDATARKNSYRWEKWIAFSQKGKGDESYVTLSDGLRRSMYSQSDIIDFVIWLLFSQQEAGVRLKHLLCDGFRRSVNENAHPKEAAAPSKPIPGLFAVERNQQVETLREKPWPQLLMLLGKEGERIMIDLLVDCAIFRAVKAGKGNMQQLCGIPISELSPLEAKPIDKENPVRPSEISFVRSRMLYARAALNARGAVHFGLRHIHVLNRFPYKAPTPTEEDTNHGNVVHILVYMFPRQFGLHNPFTSVVDRQKTTQKFQDYTLREEEIAEKFSKLDTHGKPIRHVPKRLRGQVQHLVERLQILHGRCAYAEMMKHYCPVPGLTESRKKASTSMERSLVSSSRPAGKASRGKKKTRQNAAPDWNLKYSSLTELATPTSSVSAFCQAILAKVIPNEFWGHGDAQEHNKACLLKKVHEFIHLRRFESMCLHEVMQGMKLQDIDWLAPPGLANQKCSQSDMQKRTEIFYEFLYYLFDSLLIPLIRGNFYVTDSSVDKYCLFFYRHDVWRYVAEPAMAALKTRMFEEVRLEDALRILGSRKLGLAHLRLVPKETNMRPLMNLSRRTLRPGGKAGLSYSINTNLGPVNSVLKLERTRNAERLGSSLFSVSDIYPRIKAFKTSLGQGNHKLYFAKVDVAAAYDTIPQDAMIKLLRQIPKQAFYKIKKHAEVSPLEMVLGKGSTAKAASRWPSVAQSNKDPLPFSQFIETTLAPTKKDTIFVDRSNAQKTHNTRDLMSLSTSHIKDNLIRIGKKHYRQKSGIPQGSVISSALCNYFYADLERTHLSFLFSDDNTNDSLLLRLIDDFLLITTSLPKATQFITTMHSGVPAYGVTVNPSKSLVNFPVTINGTTLSTLQSKNNNRPAQFPYTGLFINTKTLEISKDNTALTGNPESIFNSLTVEHTRCPGRNFSRKVLASFKLQSGIHLFDTSLNSRPKVLANAFAAFGVCARKMWAYGRCMGKKRQPGGRVVKDTIRSLIDVAFLLLTSKSRKERWPGYECMVTKGEVAWLVMVAFRQVLVRKQTGYREVVVWLQEETVNLSKGKKGVGVAGLIKIVRGVGT
ncbi:Telomerase reverse transcriptase [Podospora pseudoanserina]|uniref:Telomerase reverse transcriptase n=1 Tax=Podospora pseudoanserina TaxID=2609844 RepID=A0ABR0IM55_9PEZI|nr:Telomerase reverse transcriptase [Podospora pseudoanserina]